MEHEQKRDTQHACLPRFLVAAFTCSICDVLRVQNSGKSMCMEVQQDSKRAQGEHVTSTVE